MLLDVVADTPDLVWCLIIFAAFAIMVVWDYMRGG